MRRYVRINALASSPQRSGLLPVTAPTIWRWARDGKFPAPVKLSAGTTAWLLDDVEAWLQQRAATGASK